MNFKHAMFAVTAIALVSLSPAQLSAAPAKKSEAKKEAAAPAQPAAGEEAAVRAQLAALSAAALSGDAAKLATLWTADGTFVDEEGAETKGRQAIQARFENVWRGKKVNVSLNPSSIKFVGPNVAWIEGLVTRQVQGSMEPATRFTMLMQKDGNTWLVASATETAILTKTAAERLQVLDWLVGNWKSQQGNANVSMQADWVGNKSFIHCIYTAETGGTKKVDTQVIGWDPTKEQVVSWHFDSDGGFGYGSWSKRGKQWVMQAEGVEQTGSRTNATNIISVDTADKFSWQSVSRTIDGVPVPDTQPLIVQRAGK